MTNETPLSTNRVAALSRALDHISRDYHYYIMGSVDADEIADFVREMDNCHSIHASAAQRRTREQNGKANARLTVYLPDPEADTAQWLLLFTDGELDVPENVQNLRWPPYLNWLGYTSMWHEVEGKKRWTWKRNREDMQAIFDLLYVQIKLHQWDAVQATLANAAELPGFHGVTEQKWALFRFAKRHGYEGPLPETSFLAKVKHGEPIML